LRGWGHVGASRAEVISSIIAVTGNGNLVVAGRAALIIGSIIKQAGDGQLVHGAGGEEVLQVAREY
jgi:hypothetical protein